jgi:hypothetical protein
MKQYCIDELRPEDHVKIKAELAAQYGGTALDGIYRIPLAAEQMTPLQAAHGECQPYYMALDLQPACLSCELLVRSANRLRCDCIGYATVTQRNWLIALVDGIFSRLQIIT